MQAQRKENESFMMTSLASNGTWDIEENDKQNRINSVNFNATTLKLGEKFDHPFSHLFVYGYIFAQGHGFDAMAVKSSKYFLSLH